MEVEPIRKKEDIKRFYNQLLKNSTPREAELFLIGCNLALRAGDLLKLRFEDMTGTHCAIVEQKTKKRKVFPINDNVKAGVQRLKEYYATCKPWKNREFKPVYLFQATSNRVYHLCQPVCIQWVSERFKLTAAELGFTVNINTHTMRKTFGYHAYEKGRDIHYLQALFNHSSSRITLRYIGVTKSEVEKMYFEDSVDIV